MSKFGRDWQKLKRNSQTAQLQHNSAPKTKSRRIQQHMTPAKARLVVEEWESKGGWLYWKNNREKWIRWCDDAVSLDRSHIKDMRTERVIVERYSFPVRFLKHKKVSLEDLNRQGTGWYDFICYRMMKAGITDISVIEPKSKQRLTASLPKSYRDQIPKDSMKQLIQHDGHTSYHYTSVSNNSNSIDTNNDDFEVSLNEEEEDNDIIDIPIPVKKKPTQRNGGNNNNNNNNNKNHEEIKDETILSSKLKPINSVKDAIKDIQDVTGINIEDGSNQNELINVANMALTGLQKLRVQREKEIKEGNLKEAKMFDDMISRFLSIFFTAFTNGNLQTQLFSLSLGTNLSSIFFQWVNAEFSNLVNHYGGGSGLETFNLKMCRIMSNELQFKAFLNQFMLWRILYDKNVVEIFDKIDKFEFSNGMPMLDVDTQLWPDLETDNLENNNNNNQNESSQLNNNNQSSQLKNNGKLEIDDDDDI